MKKTLFLLFAVVVLSSFTAKIHKTYLSVTEIEYSKEDESLQIVSRVFIDDFEKVLNKRYGKDISLSYKEDLKNHKDLMEKYLQDKLHIKIEGKPVSFYLLGSKFDADQIVLFIEADKVRDFKKIQVENLILTDLFDSQKNIVNIKKDSTVKSMLLMKDDEEETVIF